MYKLAAMLNNEDANLYLGSLYENGNGVTSNHELAKNTSILISN